MGNVDRTSVVQTAPRLLPDGHGRRTVERGVSDSGRGNGRGACLGPRSPREPLTFRGAGEEASDFRQPGGKGIAEASDRLVLFASSEKPNELHYREEVQQRTGPPKTR